MPKNPWYKKSPQRAILVNVIPPQISKNEALKDFEELNHLVNTYGGIVILKILQKRGRPSASTFLGSGKVQEIFAIAKSLNANLIVVNDFLKPNQANNLRKIFRADIAIWDRFELILKIFEKHALSAEAKLQIELARLKYEFPKLFNKGRSLSQQAGHLGIRGGSGEKLLELKRRHLRTHINFIEEKLAKIRSVHAGQRKRRLRQGYFLAALVGYTNSGKSTIFQGITHKPTYIANQLFATLGTKIGELATISFNNKNPPLNNDFVPNSTIQPSKKILISDTIGFIKNLPPILFSSFLTTLEETQNADIILHVIDSSDPGIEEKIETVNSILNQLDCSQKPTIYIFNKTDLLNKKLGRKRIKNLCDKQSFCSISALSVFDINNLIRIIQKKLH